jgi:ribose transport system permease protein
VVNTDNRAGVLDAPSPPSLDRRAARAATYGPSFLDRYAGLIVLVLLLIVFSSLRPETFLTTTTFRLLLSEQAVTGIAAIGLLIAFAGGAYDLSIGQVLGLAVVMSTWLQADRGLGPWTAVLITLLVGALVGAVNGFLVSVVGINSFIATLAMASIVEAVIYGVTGGTQIVGTVAQGFLEAGQSNIFTIPAPVFYMVGVAAIAWFVLEHTTPGRLLYAVGSNPDAARLSGVKTGRYVFMSLVCSASLASVAGIVFATKVGSASLTAGPPYLLPAFAAVLLGTTQIKPGRANVLGTVLAIFLVATGSKGLQLMGVPIWVSSLFNGTILIVAVALSLARRRVKL